MEPEVLRLERRGRKRRREDVQSTFVDRQAKKQGPETRRRAFVGRYVKKEFEGSGFFLGKIVYYDSGLYRVEYEDGDSEDFETDEVREFLIGDVDLADEWMVRKKKLDYLIAKNNPKAEDLAVEGNILPPANAVDRAEASSLSLLSSHSGNEGNTLPPADAVDGVEASSLSLLARHGGNEGNMVPPTNAVDRVEASLLRVNQGGNEVDAVLVDGNADSSSDSCEREREKDFSLEVDTPAVPPPQLPPSSENIGVPEEYVSHLFSVYSLLRSFSIQLFLSPFSIDDFVGSLKCLVPNPLMDAIHVALMRALRRHIEMLSSDGSALASKCLRFTDWSLLDTLTWPVYLVQYLIVMGYRNGPEWKGFYIHVLEKDYYTLSVSRKLVVLQILCDDVLEAEELRAEIDMREESEVGIDSDAAALTTVATGSGPRRVHPRYSKTSACKKEEAMGIVATDGPKSSINSSYLGGHGFEIDVNSDECRLCGMDGTLLCCDGCPSAYHSRCIGVSKMSIPEGAWYCPECVINKIGPRITRGTSLRGAELFGVDSYGQVFLGTCNHLLVLKVSMNMEPCHRYYRQSDIHKVLQALHSSVQHIAMYSKICKGILQYWDIRNDFLPSVQMSNTGEMTESIKEDGLRCTLPATLLGKDSYKIVDMVEGENLASFGTESRVEDVVASCLENPCKDPGLKLSRLDTMTQTEQPFPQSSGQSTPEQVFYTKDNKFSEQSKVDFNASSASVSQQVDTATMGESATCVFGNSNNRCEGSANSVCGTVNISSQNKERNELVIRLRYRNSSDDCLYTGAHFKCHAFINNYIQGDFAASAAANLAILSSEENHVSESHASDNRRKAMSANNSLQVKAFSSAAVRFFWPNSEKKLVEVPRERCGWCLSCKSTSTSKRGCLLNAAASNGIKGAMKILSSLCHVKNGEGRLPDIAMYVMFMEESLCGLISGPFRSTIYRKQWRKQLEQATTCSAMKALLLEFEENIRIVALSGDWVKLVDNWTAESSVTQNATCAAGLTQKRGPSGRRGRKSAVVSEVTSDDCLDNPTDFNWWRGGMPSKRLLQIGVLPHSMVKKAARLGGCRKIPCIYYAEGSDIPKRSRRLIWRAAVEMCKNVTQLALQVRNLDCHVRWSDLVRPEQNLQDGKGQDTEASAFRNAFICDKKIVDEKVFYGVAFGNQKHLPSRVMKSIVEIEQGEEGKEKYWFSETRIPLYLIKEYEKNVDKAHPPLADKPVPVVSKLRRRQLKATRGEIFRYLTCKRDNLDKYCCGSCRLDVSLGKAVNCSACHDFCHEQCTISSTIDRNDEVEILITCKECYLAKTLQSKNSNESPTSPLILQHQEFQNADTVSKGAKQKSLNRQLTSVGGLQSSLDMKPATLDSNFATKRRKLCSWGLIWKKNRPEKSGIHFRTKKILLRGISDMSQSRPVCNLCHLPYNSGLTYVCCETCDNWYHAEAVELDESKISELVGFKCCRCRRIRSPLCPYKHSENKQILEAKMPRTRGPKTRNAEVDPDYGSIPEQPIEWESTTPVMPRNEEVEFAQESHLPFSLSSIEKSTQYKTEVGSEWNACTASGTGPQKLPVRRHMKREEYWDGMSANNPSEVELFTKVEANNLLNPVQDSLSPCVEWDVSENGFEENILFDYECLNYDDMQFEPQPDTEFEPQTYFSFTELLASDEGGQLDEVDASRDIKEKWENSSTVSLDGFSEHFAMGAINHQEPTISGQPAGVVQPCLSCSCTEPCPDRSCLICGLWVHSHCLPWVEQSSWEGNWICGNCRELQ